MVRHDRLESIYLDIVSATSKTRKADTQRLQEILRGKFHLIEVANVGHMVTDWHEFLKDCFELLDNNGVIRIAGVDSFENHGKATTSQCRGDSHCLDALRTLQLTMGGNLTYGGNAWYEELKEADWSSIERKIESSRLASVDTSFTLEPKQLAACRGRFLHKSIRV